MTKRLAATAVAAGLALPAPGDPLGLAGPPAFNADALEAGEAVVANGPIAESEHALRVPTGKEIAQ